MYGANALLSKPFQLECCLPAFNIPCWKPVLPLKIACLADLLSQSENFSIEIHLSIDRCFCVLNPSATIYMLPLLRSLCHAVCDSVQL